MIKSELDKLNAHIGRAHRYLEVLGDFGVDLYLDRPVVREDLEKVTRKLDRVVACITCRLDRQLKKLEAAHG